MHEYTLFPSPSTTKLEGLLYFITFFFKKCVLWFLKQCYIWKSSEMRLNRKVGVYYPEYEFNKFHCLPTCDSPPSPSCTPSMTTALLSPAVEIAAEKAGGWGKQSTSSIVTMSPPRWSRLSWTYKSGSSKPILFKTILLGMSLKQRQNIQQLILLKKTKKFLHNYKICEVILKNVKLNSPNFILGPKSIYCHVKIIGLQFL